MSVESIVGFAGLGVGLLALSGLAVFEAYEYQRTHHGEGWIHRWLADHHWLGSRRRR